MNESCYTAITFAPVQGFIEKSRKLRDLYGSSFLLSYLSRILCQAAIQQDLKVISPAIIDVTQGTPNQIIIHGLFSKADAEATFKQGWQNIVETCRQWIEEQVSVFDYCWKREWKDWSHYAWEFFWATGDTITAAKEALNDIKRPRDWVGINWKGESSTLSGTDAIAWPKLGLVNPKIRPAKPEKQEIEEFYAALSQKLGESYLDRSPKFKLLKGTGREIVAQKIGEAIITPREHLSIPELIKRLITVDAVAEKIQLEIKHPSIELSEEFIQKALQSTTIEIPEKPFKEVNRHEEESWTGWFQGDGDRMGKYLQELAAEGEETEREELTKFSKALMDWGEKDLKPYMKDSKLGRIVYAGGDDFMGVLFQSATSGKLTATECLQWFSDFHELWKKHGYADKITVSVGFVWAAPNVPQRDVLQHGREAEQSAKKCGRDRLALRVLFNSGNHLEWVCPWRFLDILSAYRDRSQKTQNWAHIYQDVAMLEARHAFTKQQINIAEALVDIYFPGYKDILYRKNWFNTVGSAGILGEPENHYEQGEISQYKFNAAVNEWIINLAKVGFHLCSNTSSSSNLSDSSTVAQEDSSLLKI
ncbi:Cas10/Cmr2 second palm domain-containing protein [Laspinema olomoucense]|uniref:Cas10/Cmr2 second palm domain-containing protein n=1 Tax=Laspinema olomoucense TaxID=3231600 RepID=UPI0021BB6A2C|nr:type III-B CRISPR-associated protein Cas10/Cmr2 [Laspinema sp. D3d]MCT7971765.1 CRISPR-associated protein Cas10 [Laspinema sp. D3d]